MKKNDWSIADSMKAFGVAATFWAFSVGGPALAETGNCLYSEEIFSSSTIQIAETIKTMDMSMPSSYDAISDVKKSSIAELTQEENLITGTIVKKAPKTSTERIGIEPKMTAEEKKAKKEALEAQKKAEKEATAAEKAAIAAEKQAEKDIFAKERAAEKALANKDKAAVKKAQADAKARASAAKEEKAKEKEYSEYKFVDAGLPSYGDATTTKGKSAFSL